ncbi:unnamed protein product, partial [Brassica oleracea]
VLPIDAFIPPNQTCSKAPLKKNCRIFLVSPHSSPSLKRHVFSECYTLKRLNRLSNLFEVFSCFLFRFVLLPCFAEDLISSNPLSFSAFTSNAFSNTSSYHHCSAGCIPWFPRPVCYTVSCCGCELHTMATLIKI